MTGRGSSASIPEFVMPPEQDAPGSAAERGGPASEAVPDTPAPHAPEAAIDTAPRDTRAEHGNRWRAPLIVGLVAVLAGMGLVAVPRAIAAAATAAEERAVVSVVDAYVAAIAEGRFADALAIFPQTGDTALLEAGPLEGVTPMHDPRTTLIEIDGDRAFVDVAYRVADERFGRQLSLVRDDGEWRLRSGLATPLTPMPMSMPQGVSVGGVVVSDGQSTTLGYPGVYAFDPILPGLVEFPDQEYILTGGPEPEGFWTPLLTTAAEAEVRAMAQAWIDACGAEERCGSVPRLEDPSVQWVEWSGFGGEGTPAQHRFTAYLLDGNEHAGELVPVELVIPIEGERLGDGECWVGDQPASPCRAESEP